MPTPPSWRWTVKREPILFLKPPSAVIGPGEAIVLPPRSHHVDYEAELAVVVGRRCRDVSPAAAAGFVAGYTCGNDVTARDLQELDGQWSRAKSFDTFCPLGPWVVPQAPSPAARVSTQVDGAEVQAGIVGDMIVSPLELLAFVSGIMTLEPGDVILTGTPVGVGPLAAGQTVVVGVEGVGSSEQPGDMNVQPQTERSITGRRGAAPDGVAGCRRRRGRGRPRRHRRRVPRPSAHGARSWPWLLAAALVTPAWTATSRVAFVTSQVRLKVTVQALTALTTAGVPAVTIKGPALAVQHWGDALSRPSVDVDVLVDIGRRARVPVSR